MAIGSDDIDASRRIIRNSPFSGITTSGVRFERLIDTSSNTFCETWPLRFAS